MLVITKQFTSITVENLIVRYLCICSGF